MANGVFMKWADKFYKKRLDISQKSDILDIINQ